jgi:hypothetical protein
MLVMRWLLLLMMVMRAGVMLVRSAGDRVREQSVLVKISGVHDGVNLDDRGQEVEGDC